MEDELESALLHITQLLNGRSAKDVAWWFCANHAKFLIDHPNINSQQIINLATKAGTPPKGNDWEEWFNRIKKL